MVVNIYVARHGQDLDNSNGILNGHRDEPLTELGRQQAVDVANKMKKAGFALSTRTTSSSSKILSAIYSSPLQRAHETAKIFANILSDGDDDGSKVEILNDLIER